MRLPGDGRPAANGGVRKRTDDKLDRSRSGRFRRAFAFTEERPAHTGRGEQRRIEMDHSIHVILVNGTVQAKPNPLPKVRPGDTVAWDLGDETVRDRDLHVEFQEVRTKLADGNEATGPCGKDGPFSSVSKENGRIFGTVAQGRLGLFIYKFFEDGTQVEWEKENRMHGEENFGGVDVPPPPPRGG